MTENSTFFAPMIYLKKVAPAIEFYQNAFDATELRRWSNDDGSVHVAEMSIHGALFHMHEESTRNNELSPETLKGTTIAIGLFVSDPHAVMAKAVAAGGTELDPVRDYDYEYRQGCVADPFGHHWLLEKKIGKSLKGDN
jgi:PhnB protein